MICLFIWELTRMGFLFYLFVWHSTTYKATEIPHRAPCREPASPSTLSLSFSLVNEWSLKIRKGMRDAAKKGQEAVCVVLVWEMIRSRKAWLVPCGRAEVMEAMQSLVKIPEIQATMKDLSKEMTEAGIIEEMLEDTFESMDDQDEMEAAAETEKSARTSGAMAASEDEEEEEALEAMQSHLATLGS
ncbi:unnamed protein product [Nyctereutes procyonoides]|uniref:(raccoon dog) hypothetical protein n=1 Tax=Nyctereutes procyonoides TaxID=34880 RepID=A0A811ZIV9_NYCPR|nr:unnamed protein product [Nyctereutes procyonoides]